MLARLQAHAAERPRFGYRRLHILLEREGLVVNHKRVHRVYREAGLQVRRRAAQAAHARPSACRCRRRAAAASAGRWTSWPTRWPMAGLSHAEHRRRLHARVRRHRGRSVAAGPPRRARPRSACARRSACRRRSSWTTGRSLPGARSTRGPMRSGVDAAFHSTRQADRERVRRELQREVSRRVLERTLVCQPGRREGRDRSVATSVFPWRVVSSRGSSTTT